ncbi:C-_U-editing enzyme APOBEC-2a [Gouania willdenowi]|uniref:C->U-editing enzyme APOBEC-2-like n=1 Tax=Gouania willdenowi TaxID=441366 RepID=A0A8C5HBM3_GOUWI|nr:C->U-editing enzyme APOBEC-2-like [Gouania willdenowi]
MADKSRAQMRKKVRSEKDAKESTEVKNEAGSSKENGDVQTAESASAADANANGAAAKPNCEELEPMEVPPFETITGDRMDPFAFRFQFKNVEYSSGRNKTFLCYLVDRGNMADGLMRGYLEDEHAGTHAEEVFFTRCLGQNDPALKYTVTWYMSSSPCADCAVKISEVLKAASNVKLSVYAARLFEWEEEEIQSGMRCLQAAGCKLRMMKPLDFSYTWDTFVDNDDQPLNLWDDCKENYEFYQEKLADILQQ